MRRRSDPGDLAAEVVELWSAATTDDFRRVLVMHPPAHRSADAFEPSVLLRKHHDLDPTGSAETAMLVLTDPRWRDGAGRLVRRIEGSGILDDNQLDRLAEAFLAANTISWTVPDHWFGDEIIVIDFGLGRAGEDEGEEGEEDDSPGDDELPPALVRREVFPPLRRWAAGRLTGRDPQRSSEVLAWADGLDARGAAALVIGLLDVVEVLEPAALEQATRWPHHSVRRLALGLVAQRDGSEAAYAIAERDPNAGIRKWAESLLGPSSQPKVSKEVAPRPPTLF